ncbi:MAG: hypothetical protein KGL58_04615 [Pseudomonadota bacterium]|nr:hypothetical protein [Pseudomonadota bacterium]
MMCPVEELFGRAAGPRFKASISSGSIQDLCPFGRDLLVMPFSCVSLVNVPCVVFRQGLFRVIFFIIGYMVFQAQLFLNEMPSVQVLVPFWVLLAQVSVEWF